MTQDARYLAKILIAKHEDYRQFPYSDTTNHLTIGYGHNLDARGMSQSIANATLDEDINYWIAELNKKLPFFEMLNASRQAVLIDMAHNLGINGLLEFTDMLHAIEKNDFNSAAQAMMDSKWATQVGRRAFADMFIMKNGDM